MNRLQKRGLVDKVKEMDIAQTGVLKGPKLYLRLDTAAWLSLSCSIWALRYVMVSKNADDLRTI